MGTLELGGDPEAGMDQDLVREITSGMGLLWILQEGAGKYCWGDGHLGTPCFHRDPILDEQKTWLDKWMAFFPSNKVRDQ